MFLRLFSSIYVIYLASLRHQTAEIATFSRLQERVINVRWCCFCARLFLLGHCRTPPGADGRFASSCERRTSRRCVFCCCSCCCFPCCWCCCLCYWRCLPFLVVVVGVLVVISVPRSNNHNIYQNLWSVPFQTTPFVNPHNVSVIPCHRTHPPTRFYCPPHSKISKNGVFIHKQALFTDFRPFFARSWVKYQPILKRFSFPDSLQQALQHCRSKFVASQTSLHENNYWNFFKGESVSVR